MSNHSVMLDAFPTSELKIPKWRPNGDRLLVQPDTAADRTASGLILLAPATVAARQKECATGRVVAMGPGLLTKDGSRWPMPDVKVGDRVLYYNQGGTRVKLDEGSYVSLRDDFIVGVMEEGTYE